MKRTFTAGQFRRNEKRIERNAQTVIDNFGTVMKVTRSRRILAVYSFMTGEWESPKTSDGVRRFHSPYIYAMGNLQLTRVF